jgi:hypothetical protein
MIFKAKLESKSPKNRTKAVKKLTDLNKLLETYKNDNSEIVRNVAKEQFISVLLNDENEINTKSLLEEMNMQNNEEFDLIIDIIRNSDIQEYESLESSFKNNAIKFITNKICSIDFSKSREIEEEDELLKPAFLLLYIYSLTSDTIIRETIISGLIAIIKNIYDYLEADSIIKNHRDLIYKSIDDISDYEFQIELREYILTKELNKQAFAFDYGFLKKINDNLLKYHFKNIQEPNIKFEICRSVEDYCSDYDKQLIEFINNISDKAFLKKIIWSGFEYNENNRKAGTRIGHLALEASKDSEVIFDLLSDLERNLADNAINKIYKQYLSVKDIIQKLALIDDIAININLLTAIYAKTNKNEIKKTAEKIMISAFELLKNKYSEWIYEENLKWGLKDIINASNNFQFLLNLYNTVKPDKGNYDIEELLSRTIVKYHINKINDQKILYNLIRNVDKNDWECSDNVRKGLDRITDQKLLSSLLLQGFQAYSDISSRITDEEILKEMLTNLDWIESQQPELFLVILMKITDISFLKEMSKKENRILNIQEYDHSMDGYDITEISTKEKIIERIKMLEKND